MPSPHACFLHTHTRPSAPPPHSTNTRHTYTGLIQAWARPKGGQARGAAAILFPDCMQASARGEENEKQQGMQKRSESRQHSDAWTCVYTSKSTHRRRYYLVPGTAVGRAGLFFGAAKRARASSLFHLPFIDAGCARAARRQLCRCRRLTNPTHGLDTRVCVL